MNKDLARTLLLAAVCSATAVFAADKADPALKRSVDTTIDTYSVDKQQLEVEANGYVIEANNFFIDGKYEQAARNYAKARFIYEKLKDNSPHFTDLLEKAKEMNAKSYYYLAQEIALKADKESNANDLESAIKHCQQAMKIYPECTDEMQERIEVYRKILHGVNRRNQFSEEAVIPDMESSKYQVAVLLKKARKLFYSKQYEEARNAYKEVLNIDKLNPQAIQGMRAVDVQLTKIGLDRFRLTHKKGIVEAAWKGVSPSVKLLNAKEREKLSKAIDKNSFSSSDENDETKAIREKLNNIVFSKVNFTGSGNKPGMELPVAIKYLVDRSKQLDPTGEGVNIYLYFPEEKTEQGEQGAENQNQQQNENSDSEAERSREDDDSSEDDDDEEDDDEKSEEDSSASNNKNTPSKNYPYVNIYLDNKPLITIIDTLAQSTNPPLKYKIEKNAVLLAPRDAKIDDMQIKVFIFDDSLLKILGGSRKPEKIMEGLRLKSHDRISFPPGSHVMYDAKFRSLIVLNTPENLQEINNYLMEKRKNKPQPLVQIQCKFVEVEQSDLKELGFIQSLSREYGNNGKTNGRLQFEANDNVLYGPTNSTFYYTPKSWKGYDYNLTINAINQLDSKDVLSSPKVLTLPDSKVIIKMTSERYFEWDYEEGELEVSTDEGYTVTSYTPPWPEFQMEELGITMEITPKVDVKNRLITLDVHPWVKTLVGWTEYKYQISADGSEGGNATKESSIKRPIIAERTTNTNVVIYDNETVVIGGIIKDYTTLVDDKVPVLGDIPLVGNFFKSKSTSIKKTNLLVFITARLLSQDGSPYYPVSDRGRASKFGLGDIY